MGVSSAQFKMWKIKSRKIHYKWPIGITNTIKQYQLAKTIHNTSEVDKKSNITYGEFPATVFIKDSLQCVAVTLGGGRRRKGGGGQGEREEEENSLLCWDIRT